ncbi:MAG: hypothetical protein PHT00_03190 [Candidatus Methanomethylophilus sp.]|jgi:hypothetical protein|nr:hypothetical protein [Methanomethylophilus sp.]MDD3233159.1 hypothetical protein [Methanomethylophilus sp.]MDD4222699.1 hypothetical protein [Methanomethylophilus sp.]MDD4669213.1 hypothetical protein [Methanomethylophilus sp.]
MSAGRNYLLILTVLAVAVGLTAVDAAAVLLTETAELRSADAEREYLEVGVPAPEYYCTKTGAGLFCGWATDCAVLGPGDPVPRNAHSLDPI